METFSIRDELLGPSPTADPPPATSLIRTLLEVAAYEAEVAEYGILTGFSIVRTARLSCDQIDATIAEIDSLPDDADEAAAWSKFNKYWGDIKVLEEMLLDQKGFFSPVDIKPKPNSVIASLNDAANWEKRREELKSQLDGLHNFLNYLNGETSPTTLPTWDQQRDDAAIMYSLISLLAQDTGDLSRHAQVPLIHAFDAVTELRTALSGIDPATHKEGIIPAIKGAWIVYAAAWESKSRSDAKQPPYISSKPVWDAVRSFSGILNGGGASGFQAAYNDLKDVLTVRVFNSILRVLTYLHLRSTGLNCSFAVPVLATPTVATRNYLNVIKAARGVRRPFLDLNNLLVRYCSELVALHNKAENGTKVANNTAVANALKYALDAAEAAQTSLPGTAAPWKGDPQDKDKVDAAFNKAFNSLKALLRIYDPAKLTGWDEAKNDAATGDVKRFELLKAKSSGNPSPVVPPTGKLVFVRIKDDATSNPRAVRIYDSVKIDTLIWREGPQFTGAKEGGTLLPLGRTIAELNLGSKTIELSTVSGGSPSSRATDTRSPSQSQAAAPTTSPSNRTQSIAPTTSPNNRTQSVAPTTSPSNRTQSVAPTTSQSSRTQTATSATSTSNRSTEYPVASGRSRGDYPDAPPSNRSTEYPQTNGRSRADYPDASPSNRSTEYSQANGRSRGNYPDARDSVPKVPPAPPTKPVANVRVN